MQLLMKNFSIITGEFCNIKILYTFGIVLLILAGISILAVFSILIPSILAGILLSFVMVIISYGCCPRREYKLLDSGV